MQTLYIMQGAPGSGKSTIAEIIANAIESEFHTCVICSTDDAFIENGKYNFRPKMLGEFHKKNLENACDAMDKGFSVIVDNTNIEGWQCKPYVEYAVAKGIPVVFIRVNGNFKSIHGVPQEAIDKMRTRMENLTVDAVLASKCPF